VIEPRAVGWQMPVILSAIVATDQLLALGALGVAPRSAAPLGPRLLGSLAAVAIITIVLVLARLTWLRTTFAREHPSVGVLSVVLAVQVGLTLSRRMLVARGALTTGPGPPFDEFVFLTATTLVVLLALGALRRHQDLVTELDATRRELESALAASTRGLVEERDRLAASVRELLEERLGPTSMRPALFTAPRLRAVVDDALRPLAHQLTAATTVLEPPRDRAASRMRAMAALRALQPTPVLRPRLLAATMFLLTFRFSVTPPPPELLADRPLPPSSGTGPDVVISVEWSSLLESLALHTATVLIVLLGSRWLARRIGPRVAPARTAGAGLERAELIRDWALTFAALIGLGLLSLAVLRVSFGLPGNSTLPPVTPLVAVGFTAPLLLITVVLSVLPAAESALGTIREELARSNDELAGAVARAQALLSHERRLFARHLHASVQAAVNAASLLIERATVEGTVDPDVIARAGTTIDDAINRLHAPTSPTAGNGEGGGSDRGGAVADGAVELDDRLAAIAATWEGLAVLETRLDAASRQHLVSDSVGRATLCDVIAEACANAVIHGRATRVSITVTALSDDPDVTVTPRGLALRVVDDGSATSPQRREGLGSRILTVSCTHWELEHRVDGTTLTATLPMR
jgi:signal transduction histidine kinase